jgi:hypothetical protein
MQAARTDDWGEYTPSPPLPPVPPFPCKNNSCCTATNRLCKDHKGILYVHILKGKNIRTPVEIPFGRWEDWEWYSHRICEATGLEYGSFRIVFAGLERRPGDSRHSGLEPQTSIHCIVGRE